MAGSLVKVSEKFSALGDMMENPGRAV